jgi:hypothetical protein
MKYYTIKHSLKYKEIGIFPQATTANYLVNIKSPEYLSNQNIPSLLPTNVSIPEPILQKKAKVTDLIYAVPISIRLVVSDKLKHIVIESLENIGIQTMQFLPMNIISKEEKIPYWLFNVYKYKMENVNFSNSEIWLEGMGGVAIEKLSLKTLEEYLKVKEQIKLPQRLYIRKVSLVKDVKDIFFCLTNVYGGVGYFVSEILKAKIEEAGCTGIEFEEVE